jgi:hypothetical protein
MKRLSLVGLVLLLAGCQGVPAPLPEIIKPKPEPQKVAEPPVKPAEPVKPTLALADDALTLQAWQLYRLDVLQMNNTQRDAALKALEKTPVAELQALLLRLHPEATYAVRFKAQNQLSEQLSKLPPGLAALLRWDYTWNQKLLESESAVRALSRLNGQQQDNLDKQLKLNKDLQKKIDALTAIEAKLNQSGGG